MLCRRGKSCEILHGAAPYRAKPETSRCGYTVAHFLNMFRHVSPDTLDRFLSETASVNEVSRVMLALPKVDFLKATVLPVNKRRPREPGSGSN